MKDRLLFLRAFARTLCICLAVWAAAMAALVWLNWRWSAEDIILSLDRTRTCLSDSPGAIQDRGTASQYLTINGIDALEQYGGQMYLRAYDEEGNVLGQSQLLTAFVGLGDIAWYALFDAAMTDAEQLAAARLLMEYPWLKGSQPYDEASAAFEGLDLTGWVEGEVIYPVKAVLHLDGEEITLVDADPAQFPGKRMETFHTGVAEFYSELAGRGGPEKRLERYRALEAEIDELEELSPMQETILKASGRVTLIPATNAELDTITEPAMASSYFLPRFSSSTAWSPPSCSPWRRRWPWPVG